MISPVKVINSEIYGTLFTNATFQLFDKEVSNNVTIEGQKILNDLKEIMNYEENN